MSTTTRKYLIKSNEFNTIKSALEAETWISASAFTTSSCNNDPFVWCDITYQHSAYANASDALVILKHGSGNSSFFKEIGVVE